MSGFIPSGLSLDKSAVDWLKYCDWGKFVPLMYVSTTGGLCNRLFGIASCVPKAHTENRLLKVYWPLNGDDGTSAKWSDLFEDPLDLFTEWDLYWMMDVMHDVRWFQNIEDAYGQIDSTNVILVKSYYDFFLKRASSTFDMLLAHKWLNSITIKQDILSRVADFGLEPGTLGVHLRVKEANFPGPSQFEENPASYGVLDSMRRWPGQVLVVSNCHKTKRRMVDTFGDKIVLQDNLAHDRGCSATQSALVDLILLSMCPERIGNHASTFFSLSNIWSGRKFV